MQCFLIVGTRYVIDKTLGNCTVLPLTNTSGEAQPRSNSGNSSSSYIITLKNPLQLFDIASNYTFIGQVCRTESVCKPLNSQSWDSTYNSVLQIYFQLPFLSDFTGVIGWNWLLPNNKCQNRTLNWNSNARCQHSATSQTVVLSLIQYKVTGWIINEDCQYQVVHSSLDAGILQIFIGKVMRE